MNVGLALLHSPAFPVLLAAMEIVLVVMVVFAVVVVVWLGIAQSGESPAPGTAAPGFDLPGVDGGRYALADLRGRRAVLVFHPRDETPECLAIVAKLAGAMPAIQAAGAVARILVVGPADSSRAYDAAHPVGAPVLCDADGRVAKAYGALVNLGFLRFARKLVVLVEADGKVARVWRENVGPQHVDELLAALGRAGN